MNSIRNFSIIAHVDHGKSTLADRMLQLTNTVTDREIREQFLDKIELERERGITIKLQAVRMVYGGGTLNLIDTPGHIDFSYEVSRALAACEGAVLLVDASQGIQAQTLANYQKARNADLTIIPVVNKIDLASANPDEVALDMAETFGFKFDEILYTSGKTGQGVTKLLDEIVTRIPCPKAVLNPTGLGSDARAPLRALIFDSFYDEHLGVIALVRVVDGEIAARQNLRLMHGKKNFEPLELGYITSRMEPTRKLTTGEVGYIATGLKDISRVRVGDTITTVCSAPRNSALPDLPRVSALLGYTKPKPMVFANLFPQNSDELKNLRAAVEKYNLTDAAFTFKPINSPALGMGFRCGFLGLLHLDVVRERLQQEFGVATQITAPSVEYRVQKTDGSEVMVRSPEELPSPNKTSTAFEPWAKVKIYTLDEHLGGLMKICEDRRGEFGNLEYLSESRVKLTYQMPLAEIIAGFFDQVKSVSSGYASLDYEVTEYKKAGLVKLDILLNKERHAALSRLVIREKAEEIGQKLVQKLQENLPRQQFSVPIQAVVGGKIVARTDLPAQRKNVTDKLYGGDRTRKDKLLKKQAEGKKRLQQQGSVHVPEGVLADSLQIIF